MSLGDLKVAPTKSKANSNAADHLKEVPTNSKATAAGLKARRYMVKIKGALAESLCTSLEATLGRSESRPVVRARYVRDTVPPSPLFLL